MNDFITALSSEIGPLVSQVSQIAVIALPIFALLYGITLGLKTLRDVAGDPHARDFDGLSKEELEELEREGHAEHSANVELLSDEEWEEYKEFRQDGGSDEEWEERD